MKKIYFLLLILVSWFFVQCDSPERRQKKAQDVIKKHLYETLDNFNSYEPLSTSLDTLNAIWLLSAEIRELGERYVEAKDERDQISEELNDLENKIESSRQAAVSSLFSGNGGGFWAHTFSMQGTQEQVEKLQTAYKMADSKFQTLGDSILAKFRRTPNINEFKGWYVTHKFRYTDGSGEPRIYTEYYIMDPKLSLIVYSIEETDYFKCRMINEVTDLIRNRFVEEPVSPTDEESVSPTDEESVSPSDEESVSPIDEESVQNSGDSVINP